MSYNSNFNSFLRPTSSIDRSSFNRDDGVAERDASAKRDGPSDAATAANKTSHHRASETGRLGQITL